MSTKFAESLAEAVVALPKEDYDLFQEALTNKLIRKTPGVVGGVACIRNTRVAVWLLISLINQGMDDAALLRDYPGLTRFDLLAMRAYYQANKTEIDEEIIEQHKDDRDELNQPSQTYRKAGSAAGKIWMSPDFDEPLEDFKDYM